MGFDREDNRNLTQPIVPEMEPEGELVTANKTDSTDWYRTINLLISVKVRCDYHWPISIGMFGIPFVLMLSMRVLQPLPFVPLWDCPHSLRPCSIFRTVCDVELAHHRLDLVERNY